MNSQQYQIFKFLVSGVFVLGIDVGIYTLLIHWLPHAVSKEISFTCGGIATYLVNKYWTFEQKTASSSEVGRFVIGNGSALILNVGTNELVLRASGGQVLVALAVATTLTAVYTFFVFKYWVFTGPRVAP